MRIVCIGGGPAGLYFGLLMKGRNPAYDVTVVERNRPYDTFGWGVVFSDQTLGNLAAADPETASAITDAFNHWDDIAVHFKGRTFTFAFVETPHGWFQAHAYQYDGDTSTFIVETPEETWRASGLEAMSQEDGI